ncbi:MAG: hypothetical protein ABEI31_09500 [Halodesulfurarchaeum sp.]
METVVDLVETVTVPAGEALIAPDVTHGADFLRESIYRTGNFLRHCGVHEGAAVRLIDVREPETVFALLGSGLLGASVSFEPDGRTEPSALIGPTARLGSVSTPTGCTRVAFGEQPEDPSWAHFDAVVWSENPFFPETDIAGSCPFLARGEVSQRVALGAAETVAEQLSPEDIVAVRAPLSTPGTVIAGILAPLVAGASILLPDGDTNGTVAVAESSGVPEQRRLDPEEVEIP